MPHPFHPDDFPLNGSSHVRADKVFFLKGCIHFKTTARIVDCTSLDHKTWRSNFSHGFITSVARAANEVLEHDEHTYEVTSCGNMMRTIKTLVDAKSGDKLADLNITFVSFGSSSVRFPKESEHSRHEIEMFAVSEADAKTGDRKHEAFVRHSIPYFWDMVDGPEAILYKAWNQERIEVARVAAYGFNKDAILVLESDHIDDVVALATAIIFLNGREAIDSC